METLITLIISAIIGCVVGMAIGDLGGKKNGAKGGLLGALLGPLGWIIVAVLPPSEEAKKAAPAQSAANDAEKRRIAALEAEVRALKTTKPKAARVGCDISDDGGVPTYKLD